MLVILAGGILLASFHYHEGGRIIDDCPVCRFQDSGTIASNYDIAAHNLLLPAQRNEVIQEHGVIFISYSRSISTLPNGPPISF